MNFLNPVKPVWPMHADMACTREAPVLCRALRAASGAGSVMAMVLALAACATATPDPLPSDRVPPAFRERQADAPDSAVVVSPQGGWWKTFEDPQLDALIALAMRDSPGIRSAAARLAKARSVLGVADASR